MPLAIWQAIAIAVIVISLAGYFVFGRGRAGVPRRRGSGTSEPPPS